MINVYCIFLSTNPESLLDIMNVNELLFPYYKDQTIYAIGLAKGYYEAMDLLVEVIDEIYRKTGDVKVREYLQDRWG